MPFNISHHAQDAQAHKVQRNINAFISQNTEGFDMIKTFTIYCPLNQFPCK